MFGRKPKFDHFKCTFFLFLALGSMIASAGERVFQPVPRSDQSIRYLSGTASVRSAAPESYVSASFAAESKKEGWVRLFVVNEAATPINFGESSVSAHAGNSPLKVFSFAEIEKKLKRQQMWEGIAAGMAAGANSYNAGMAGTSTTSGRFSGYSNSGSVQGTYSGTTYNSADAATARALANEQNRQIFESVSATANADRNFLESRAIRLTTLDQGQEVFGDVRLVLPKKVRGGKSSFTVIVTVGQDVHEFDFLED